MARSKNGLLWNYTLSQIYSVTSSIVSLVIEANYFELQLAFITFVEREQFSGHPTENPNVHLCNFLGKCDTIKLSEVSTNAIQLRLFPFFLKDRASDGL